jgi:amino acid transporter
MPIPTSTHAGKDHGQAVREAEKGGPGRPWMSAALFNFWLDVALFATIVFVLWVSILLEFVFPVPTQAEGWKLWGLSFDQWRDVQFCALCVFVLLALEHVVLHWNWICSIIATQVLRRKNRPDKGNQAILGVGTFILLLLIIQASLLAAMLTIQRPPR